MCFKGMRGGLRWTYNFQLALGHSANAVGPEVGVTGLDATQATKVLIALLLPLGDQVLVRIAFFYAVIVQLCGQMNFFFFFRNLATKSIKNKNTLNCPMFTSQNQQPKIAFLPQVSNKKYFKEYKLHNIIIMNKMMGAKLL